MASATVTKPKPFRIELNLPFAFAYLLTAARYKIGYGGRGSAKSWSYARSLVAKAFEKPLRILCARELQTSIAESVHQLLADQISDLGLDRYFVVLDKGIYRKPHPWELASGGRAGSEFFFYGIRNNPTKVKSAEGIDIVWCEEAEKISHRSWEILIPTIRQPNSEIWISFNPDEESDPTYQRFVVKPPQGAVPHKVDWEHNPYFPEILKQEKDYLYLVDPEAADHVWGGNVRRNQSSQIFRGKYVVEDFVPPVPSECTPERPMWDGPYFGCDFGFANDPARCTKLWINEHHKSEDGKKRKRLYVEYSVGGIGIDNDPLVTCLKRVPQIDGRLIQADNARPETISHINRTGYCENMSCDFTFNTEHPEPRCPLCGGRAKFLRMEAAEKWNGSVEDGVGFLKTFEIVIHSRCKAHIDEAKFYSYKVDRLTKEVLPEIVDKNNHCWDADRYALGKLIKNTTKLGMWSRL